MAIAIKSIPTLKAEAAENFIEKVKVASQKKQTIDFSKQIKTASAILKKANL
ncbi:MAG: hypothetical protein OCD76_03105 [Reichenbachiella sp.]